MPTKRIEHVDRPFYMPRHVPDSSRLAALYTRMGETLARLSMARGENTARGLENFAGLFSNYRGEKRADAAAQAAAARRAIEREEDKAFARETADADRKARASERKEDADRSSARFAFSETAAGPISAATADLLRRFPETAGIVRDAETLPATVTPGAAGVVSPDPARFSVKEPTDDQAERSRARLAMEQARADAMKRAGVDDARADRQLSQQVAYQNASLEIQRQAANTAAQNARARLGITGNDLPSKYRNPLERAILSTPANRRGAKVVHAERLLAEGNEKELKDFIRQTAIEGENVDTKNQVLGRMATIASLRDTRAILRDLAAAGVDTNILTGTVEDVLRKLGTTSDPRLVEMRNRLSGTLINYRRAATGVAFGEKEGAQYEKMFPNYKNTLPVNEALISGLMREMQSYDRTYWEHKLGGDGAKVILGDDYAEDQAPAPSAPGAPRPRILSIVPVTKP